jgi:hypothetical protein
MTIRGIAAAPEKAASDSVAAAIKARLQRPRREYLLRWRQQGLETPR